MQTRSRLFILFFITAFVIFSSCNKKTNKEGRYIPNSASLVLIINGESMSSKLPWEEIKQTEFFKEIYTDTSLQSYMKNFLENPENTGIDTKKNLLLFVQKDSSGGGYIAFEGMVTDAAKFKDFNSKLAKDAAESEKDGIHYLTTKKLTSSWDKEKFVVVVDAPQLDSRTRYSRYDMNDSSTSIAAPARNTMATAGSIYSLLENNSMAKDEKFSDLVHTKGDIHFWMNIGSLAADSREMAALSMMNMSKFSADSYLTGVANFENGRIDIDFKTYSGKELSDLYKKYSGSKLNTDMIKRIPTQNIAAVFAASFKPEGLKEIIRLAGLDGFINLGAARYGFTMDDFIKANKGDILLSVADIKQDGAGAPKMNALFAASVADKNAFGKLIEAAGKLLKEESGGADKYFSYNVSNDFFAVGTEKATVDKFISSSNNSNFNFLDKVAGSSSVFYVNIPVLANSMGNEMSRDSLDNLGFQATIKTWESVIMTGNGFKDGANLVHAEINFADKNTNSLKQLNKYISTMTEIQEQKKKRWAESDDFAPGRFHDTTLVAQDSLK